MVFARKINISIISNVSKLEVLGKSFTYKKNKRGPDSVS